MENIVRQTIDHRIRVRPSSNPIVSAAMRCCVCGRYLLPKSQERLFTKAKKFLHMTMQALFWVLHLPIYLLKAASLMLPLTLSNKK